VIKNIYMWFHVVIYGLVHYSAEGEVQPRLPNTVLEYGNLLLWGRGVWLLTLCCWLMYKRCDCSPMCCWQVTSFVFLHNIMHMHLSVGVTHLSLQGYQQLDAGHLCLKLQSDQSWPPIFRTLRLQQRDHSFRYSVFLQLQSWLCVGMFCKRTIFCVIAGANGVRGGIRL
jgi:hypothetical protein